MLRFISHLLKLNYEPCKGCEVREIQLQIANQERAELLKTIMSFVKPEVIQRDPIVVEPVKGKGIPWAVRKRHLEENDREQARIIAEGNVLKAKLSNIKDKETEQKIEELEKELGLEEDNASKVG